MWYWNLREEDHPEMTPAYNVCPQSNLRLKFPVLSNTDLSRNLEQLELSTNFSPLLTELLWDWRQSSVSAGGEQVSLALSKFHLPSFCKYGGLCMFQIHRIEGLQVPPLTYLLLRTLSQKDGHVSLFITLPLFMIQSLSPQACASVGTTNLPDQPCGTYCWYSWFFIRTRGGICLFPPGAVAIEME